MAVIRSKPYVFGEEERQALFFSPRWADAASVAQSAAPMALSDIGPSHEPGVLSDEQAQAHGGDSLGARTLHMTLCAWRSPAEAARALRVAQADGRQRASMADYATAEAAAEERRIAKPRMSKPRPPLVILDGDTPSRRRSHIVLADEFLAAHHVAEVMDALPIVGSGTNGAGRRWGASVAASQARSAARQARTLTRSAAEGQSAAQRLARVTDERRDAAVSRVNVRRTAKRLAELRETGASVGLVIPADADPADAAALILAAPAFRTLPEGRQRALKIQATRLAQARIAPQALVVERTSRTMTGAAIDQSARVGRLAALAGAGALSPVPMAPVGRIPDPVGPWVGAPADGRTDEERRAAGAAMIRRTRSDVRDAWARCAPSSWALMLADERSALSSHWCD